MSLLRDSGEITISNCSINAKYNIDKIRKDFAGKIEKEEDVNSWISFYLGRVIISDQFFSARLMFSPQGNLTFIFLALMIAEEQLKWENWSAESEQKRNERQNQFLIEMAGDPPYNFKWGEIVSEISPQSGSAEITIRYR